MRAISNTQYPFLWAAASGGVFFAVMFAVQASLRPIDENLFRLAIAVMHFPLMIWMIAKHPDFWGRVRQGLVELDKKTVAGYIGAMCLSVYLCGTPILRNCMFFFYGLPAFIIYAPYVWAKIRQSDYLTKIAYVMVVFTFVQIIVPGLYIPPFLDGIAGWHKRITPKTKVMLTGLKLVRKDGKEIWLSNAYADPGAFIVWMLRDTLHTVGDETMMWFFTIYKKNWDLTLQGKTPNQRYLGAFGYPGHNPYLSIDYRDFPPESIVKLMYLTERYDQQTMELLSREIFNEYELTDEDRKPYQR